MFSPRRLALHCMFPRKTRWLSHIPDHGWSNISICGTVSFSMHTPSPLHFMYQALNFSVPCTSPVCQQSIAGNHQQFSLFLSLSLSFSLPLSLLHPMSKLAEATMLKSSRKEPAHSTALLYICRLLWFQGKSKGGFA